MAWIKPRIGSAAGNGHARRPSTPTTALTARLMTNRHSIADRITILLRRVVHASTRPTSATAPRGLHECVRRLLRAPRDKFTILRQGGVDQLIEHVIGGVV